MWERFDINVPNKSCYWRLQESKVNVDQSLFGDFLHSCGFEKKIKVTRKLNILPILSYLWPLSDLGQILPSRCYKVVESICKFLHSLTRYNYWSLMVLANVMLFTHGKIWTRLGLAEISNSFSILLCTPALL